MTSTINSSKETPTFCKKINKKTILMFGIWFTHSIYYVNAQADWKLKLNNDGIRIYARTFPESKIKALKVECSVEATLSQMAAILLDIKSQDEWFYHTKSVVLLKISPSELYYYAEVAFPFPYNNRDFVEHIKLVQNPLTRIIVMEVENVSNYIPQKQGIVRVLHSNCKWIITPVGNKVTSLEFSLFADPGGSIPIWLINIFSVYGPFETFKKLKTQLKKPEYANVYFPFITD
jgi:START domain